MCLTPIFLTVKGSHPISISCGKCPECRLARQNSWFFRLYQEHKKYLGSGISCVFITLTYDSKHFPYDGGLHSSDIQNFFKRLRINFLRKYSLKPEFKYFCAGEYGGKFGRPHYHIILFGLPNADSKEMYDLLLNSWGKGIVDRKYVTPSRLSYVAKYSVKESCIVSNSKHYNLVRNGSKILWYNRKTKSLISNNFIVASKNLGLNFLTTSRIIEIVFKGIRRFDLNGKMMYLPRYYVDYLDRKKNLRISKKIVLVHANDKSEISFNNYLNSMFYFHFFKKFCYSYADPSSFSDLFLRLFPFYSSHEDSIKEYVKSLNTYYSENNLFSKDFLGKECSPISYVKDLASLFRQMIFLFSDSYKMSFEFVSFDEFLTVRQSRFYNSFVHKDIDKKLSYFFGNRFHGNIFVYENYCRSLLSKFGYFITYCF